MRPNKPVRSAPPPSPARLSGTSADRIALKGDGSYRVLGVAELVWIEAVGHRTRVHTLGESLVVHMSLRQLEGRLSPAGFLRIHRSCIVNPAYVAELQPKSNGDMFVRLADGRKLTLSRTRRLEAASLLAGMT